MNPYDYGEIVTVGDIPMVAAAQRFVLKNKSMICPTGHIDRISGADESAAARDFINHVTVLPYRTSDITYADYSLPSLPHTSTVFKREIGTVKVGVPLPRQLR